MFSHNMKLVYIGEDWVVKEYLRHVKEKYWEEGQAWGDKQYIEIEKEISHEFSAGAADEENVNKSDDDDVDDEQIVEVEGDSDSSSDSDT